jgi:hypothetical protein
MADPRFEAGHRDAVALVTSYVDFMEKGRTDAGRIAHGDWARLVRATAKGPREATVATVHNLCVIVDQLLTMVNRTTGAPKLDIVQELARFPFEEGPG